MTDNQKFGFYLPVWRRAMSAREWFRTNGPKCKGPKLNEVLARQEQEFRSWPDPAGPAALQIVTIAKQTALQDSRSVTADDLRRACTFVATVDLSQKGYNSPVTNSTKHLNNVQVNHLDTLLKLLIEPDDLKHVTWWLHPEMREKQGLIDNISRLAPEGTLRAIFANSYGTKDWRDGSKQQLVWLLKQVKNRTRQFRKPVQTTEARRTEKRDLELLPAGGNDPF